MKIYEVLEDVNRFQLFHPEKRDGEIVSLRFKGAPFGDRWRPPDVRIYNPRGLYGDFFGFQVGALTATPRAMDFVRDEFNAAGELLPLPYQGQVFTVLNILQCVDCLDHRATKVRQDKDGRRYPYAILEFAFRVDLLPKSSLFKIPEQAVARIYTIEGRSNPENEFKGIVDANGLTGLKFRKVWEG